MLFVELAEPANEPVIYNFRKALKAADYLEYSGLVDSNSRTRILKINSHNLQILRLLGTMFADRVQSRSLRNLLEQKSVQGGNSVLKFKLLCLHGVLR